MFVGYIYIYLSLSLFLQTLSRLYIYIYYTYRIANGGLEARTSGDVASFAVGCGPFSCLEGQGSGYILIRMLLWDLSSFCEDLGAWNPKP